MIEKLKLNFEKTQTKSQKNSKTANSSWVDLPKKCPKKKPWSKFFGPETDSESIFAWFQVRYKAWAESLGVLIQEPL